MSALLPTRRQLPSVDSYAYRQRFDGKIRGRWRSPVNTPKPPPSDGLRRWVRQPVIQHHVYPTGQSEPHYEGEHAAAAQAEARQLARALAAHGVAVRDVGEMLGVSFHRAAVFALAFMSFL